VDILIVDDSKVMRSLVKRAIRQAGYRDLAIGEAENGERALAQLSLEETRLVISDWNMPEMSGIELLNEIRAARNKVPFGFITSEASTQIHEQARHSGANFILTKPFTVDDVQGVLAAVLGD
jgi:two-component system chemotaxis response regulator CheY